MRKMTVFRVFIISVLMIVVVAVTGVMKLKNKVYWSFSEFRFPVPDCCKSVEYRQDGLVLYYTTEDGMQIPNNYIGNDILFCKYWNMTAVDVVGCEKPELWKLDNKVVLQVRTRDAQGHRKSAEFRRIVVLDADNYEILISDEIQVAKEWLSQIRFARVRDGVVEYESADGVRVLYPVRSYCRSSCAERSVHRFCRAVSDLCRSRDGVTDCRIWKDEKTGYEWMYVISNQEVKIVNEITHGNAVSPSPTGTLYVPKTIAGCPVTSIGEYAFINCRMMKRIVLPSTISNIGGDAPWAVFCGCSQLEQIDVDPGNAHFSSFDGILYDGSSEVLLRVPPGAFKVDVPEGVRSIASAACYQCTRLKAITLPSTIAEVGHSPFSCSALEEVHFLGDSPVRGRVNEIYDLTSCSLVTYVKRNSKGWGSGDDFPEMWRGRKLCVEDK